MSEAHVDLSEQVVTPGEELSVKIIDFYLYLQRRRISLSIKLATEGGVKGSSWTVRPVPEPVRDKGGPVGPPLSAEAPPSAPSGITMRC